MSAQEKGLVLVSVVLESKKTSVSMDDKLFGYLAARLGSVDAANRWLRAEAVFQNRSGEGASLKSGLSRLIQRRAMDVLIGGAPFGHGFDAAPEESTPAEAESEA